MAATARLRFHDGDGACQDRATAASAFHRASSRLSSSAVSESVSAPASTSATATARARARALRVSAWKIAAHRRPPTQRFLAERSPIVAAWRLAAAAAAARALGELNKQSFLSLQKLATRLFVYGRAERWRLPPPNWIRVCKVRAAAAATATAAMDERVDVRARSLVRVCQNEKARASLFASCRAHKI